MGAAGVKIRRADGKDVAVAEHRIRVVIDVGLPEGQDFPNQDATVKFKGAGEVDGLKLEKQRRKGQTGYILKALVDADDVEFAFGPPKDNGQDPIPGTDDAGPED